MPALKTDTLNVNDPEVVKALLRGFSDFVPESGHLLLDDAFDSIGTMILEYLRARYLRAPHDHGGVTMLQLERRPSWVDPEPVLTDDGSEPAVPDPAHQEVGPNP